MKYLITFIWIFICSSFLSQTDVIQSINLSGLSRTKEVYIRKNLLCEEGTDFDRTKLEKDLLWLRRLDRFFEVDTSVVKDSDGLVINFQFREAEYRYPMLGLDFFSDVFKVYVGGKDLNSNGTMTEVGAHYLFYDRHSFAAYVKKPFINRKYGAKIRLSKYSTNEPLYFLDTSSVFEFDNYALTLGAHRWVKDVHQISAEVSGFKEFYRQKDMVELGLPGREFDFWKYQIRLGYQFNNLAYFFEQINGTLFKINLETVQTKGFPEASFFKGDAELRKFWSKKFLSIAYRGQFGISTNNFSPFTPYVVDGFVSVRGIGNRIDRGTAQVMQALECRFRVLRNDLLIAQLAGFLDGQQLRLPGSTELLNSKIYYSTGIGVRILPQRWYKTTLRLDYAITTSENRPGVSFGLGHFF